MQVDEWIKISDVAIQNPESDYNKLSNLLEIGKQLEDKLNEELKVRPILKAKVIDVMIVMDQLDKLNNLIVKKDNILRTKLLCVTKDLFSLLESNKLGTGCNMKIAIDQLERIPTQLSGKSKIRYNITYTISDVIEDCEIQIY